MSNHDEPLRLFVDTNVWMGLLYERSSCSRETDGYFETIVSRAACLASPLSFKDVFYLVALNLKADVRAEGYPVDRRVGAAANAIAWECVQDMAAMAVSVNVGESEVTRALELRATHSDFEDDLIVAAAETSGADYIVTNDRGLVRDFPDRCLTPAQVVDLLDAQMVRPKRPRAKRTVR